MAEYSSPSSGSSDSENEQSDVIEVGSYSVPRSILLTVLTELKDEELVVKSSRGPSVVALAEAFLANMAAVEVDNFSEGIVKQLQSCLRNRAGRISLAKLWRNFHVLRLSVHVKSLWQSSVDALHLPDTVKGASDITMQLILKRMMHNVIKQLSKTHSPPPQAVASLTPRECNIVRYIAGYIVYKLKKKYPQYSSFFDQVVVTTCHYVNISSVTEYSRMWTEQVDRGGLYHVNEDFYNLLKEIECICRQYLDTRAIPSASDVSEKISRDALAHPVVIGLWNSLSVSSDNTLLKAIIELWINIRVHSFTQEWSDVLRKKIITLTHEKALRNTLKHKGTEKDYSAL